ncbi:MAG TPA: hypothetical protein PLI18_17380 [Pirellulaceae bacterium]|nr:hypothetical protein [Pirellulaceae bacterium]
MAAVNRNDLIAKVQKVARKHFQPTKSPGDRSVFETLIFGCCLENATNELAEEAFARLQENYYDWNEVRVTTVPELAESMVGYVDPQASAARVKRSLHAIFETHYAFDLEPLRKENLGKAIERLKAYKGVTDFVASYVAQTALGGHVIPLDEAMLKLFAILDLAGPKDIAASTVPGLERAVPKAKGSEFFGTVHQLAVQWFAAQNSTKTWAIIAEIDPEARTRHNQATKAAAEAAAKAEEVRQRKVEEAKAAKIKHAVPKGTGAGKAEPPKGAVKPAADKGGSSKPADKSPPPKPPVAPPAPAAAKKPEVKKPEPKGASKPPAKPAGKPIAKKGPSDASSNKPKPKKPTTSGGKSGGPKSGSKPAPRPASNSKNLTKRKPK